MHARQRGTSPDNPAEDRVLVVQVLAGLVRDEELRPRRVRAGVGHAQHAALVVRHARLELVLYLAAPVALAPPPRPRRITALKRDWWVVGGGWWVGVMGGEKRDRGEEGEAMQSGNIRRVGYNMRGVKTKNVEKHERIS